MPFLRLFFAARQRMGKRTFTERARLAAQGEAVGEDVEKLVFPYLSPPCHHERQVWGAKCVAFLVGEGLGLPVSRVNLI